MIKPQRLRTRLVAVSAAVLTAMCAGLFSPAQPSGVALSAAAFNHRTAAVRSEDGGLRRVGDPLRGA